MSIRIQNKSGRKYIESLLDEMENDKEFCFEIDVKERRQNGTINMLKIIAIKELEETKDVNK